MSIARFISFLVLGFISSAYGKDAPVPVDAHAPAPYARPPSQDGIARTSYYVPMRDGIEIALDVLLPADLKLGARVPAILQQTRYWRSPGLRWPFSWFIDPLDQQGLLGQIKRDMVAHGYAWVDVDTRGSGASFGTRAWDFSPDEIKDGNDVANWIQAQSWSDGRIMPAGASYGGTSAEFALTNRHRAFTSAIIVSSEFDQYADILAPGGIPLNYWYKEWGALTAALDANVIPGADTLTRLASQGVAPVNGAAERLDAAVAQHQDNYDFSSLQDLLCRDDISPLERGAKTEPQRATFVRQADQLAVKFGPNWRDLGVDVASTHAYNEDIAAANVPRLIVAGWFDGTYANAAAKRFNSAHHPGDKLILGPWDHTQFNISPWTLGRPTGFSLAAEALKFADRTLPAIPKSTENDRVLYYTMGLETWRSAPTWPVPSKRTIYWLGSNGILSSMRPSDGERAIYEVDFSAGTGPASRFDTLMNRRLSAPYPDRDLRDQKLLVHETSPLDQAVEVTGHPLAHLTLSLTTSDAAVFLYLEDVDLQGEVHYVTEGMLRVRDRKVSPPPRGIWTAGPYHTFNSKDVQPAEPETPFTLDFELLPTSYVFQKGHRIRLALAGADRDHFAQVPNDGTKPRIDLDQSGGSYIDLPIVATKIPRVSNQQ